MAFKKSPIAVLQEKFYFHHNFMKANNLPHTSCLPFQPSKFSSMMIFHLTRLLLAYKCIMLRNPSIFGF